MPLTNIYALCEPGSQTPRYIGQTTFPLGHRLSNHVASAKRGKSSNASGIADVVTADELYEVKAYLTRDAVIKAIGQLEIYSQELTGRNKIIVGRHGDGIALRSFANRLGIEMRIWRRKDA